MGVIIGVVVGFALGSRAGSEGWSSEIEEAWRTITTSEEVRDFVSGGISIARDVLERRAEVIAGILGVSDELAKLNRAA
jgi:hypothetical protein